MATVEEQNAEPEELNPKVMEVRDEKKEAKTELVDKLETLTLLK